MKVEMLGAEKMDPDDRVDSNSHLHGQKVLPVLPFGEPEYPNVETLPLLPHVANFPKHRV